MNEGHFTSKFKKDYCVICNLGNKNTEPVCVAKKGILNIIECCEKHVRGDFHTYLNKCISADPAETVLVHSELPLTGRRIVACYRGCSSFTATLCVQSIHYSHVLQSPRVL